MKESDKIHLPKETDFQKVKGENDMRICSWVIGVQFFLEKLISGVFPIFFVHLGTDNFLCCFLSHFTC